MSFKMIAGLIGLLALLAFLAPPVIKLKSAALTLVIVVGAAMAAYEYYENIRGKDD